MTSFPLFRAIRIEPTPFASDGTTTVMQTGAQDPPAFYDSVGNKTWCFWHNDNKTGTRRSRVRVFNHSTQTWGTATNIAISSFGDDHGCPSAVMDADGYVHVFQGNHNNAAQHTITTNPRNESAWTALSTVGGSTSYSRPFMIGAELWVGFRCGNTGSAASTFSLFHTSVTNGVPNGWSSEIVLADFQPNVCYPGGISVRNSTEVHATFSFAGTAGFPASVYFLIYDTVTGSIFNIDRSVEVLSSSLPINATTANTSFRIKNIDSTKYTTGQSNAYDSAGNYHILFSTSNTTNVGDPPPNDTALTISHDMWNGSSWVGETVLGTTYKAVHGGMELCALDNGVMDCYLPINKQTDQIPWFRQGQIYRVRRFADGTFREIEFLQERNRRFDGITYPGSSVTPAMSITSANAVFNAHPDIRMVWAEAQQANSQSFVNGRFIDGLGTCRAWAYGDSGFK